MTRCRHDDIEGSLSSQNENSNATVSDQSVSNLPVPPSHEQLRRRVKSITSSEVYSSNNTSRRVSERSNSPHSSSSDISIIARNHKTSWTFDHLLVPSICVSFGVIIWFLCIVYSQDSTTPSSLPSSAPTASLSKIPSYEPTTIPSKLFSPAPSYAPSPSPTFMPTSILSNTPSKIHSMSPSNIPSISKSPSQEPSRIPTSSPSKEFAWDQFGETLYGEKGMNYYGFSIALSTYGRHLAIGQHQGNRIDVYFRLDGQWIKSNSSIIDGEDNGLGFRVAISGEGVRVASLGYNSLNTVMAR